MTSLVQTIRRNIDSHGLIAAKRPVLVAVSGGLDSLVLLHVLVDLSQSYGWQLNVAHFNHRLRGVSSDADERLVRTVARKLHVRAVFSGADVRTAARASGESLEMAGRRLRHEFLARAAVELGIATIALAHHLDDQIELFFLRLLRGSSPQGLAGMRWRNASPANGAIVLVRPLLNCPKALLQDFATERKIPFREDTSNAASDFQRNRIRNKLLPLLRRDYQPALNTSIWRLMDIAAVESDFLRDLAAAWLVRHGLGAKQAPERGLGVRLRSPHPDAPALVGAFASLPIAVQRRCLELQLLDLGIQPDYDLIEHLRLRPGVPVEVAKAQAGHGACLELKFDSATNSPGMPFRLVQSGGTVRPAPGVAKARFGSGGAALDLTRAGGQTWHGVRLTWNVKRSPGQKLPTWTKGREVFDADKVGPQVQVRHWRPGDRFQPTGFLRPTKLQDLFVNQKVPREARHRLLVGTTASGELFWVEGFRISDRFKLTPQTIRRLHWRWQRL